MDRIFWFVNANGILVKRFACAYTNACCREGRWCSTEVWQTLTSLEWHPSPLGIAGLCACCRSPTRELLFSSFFTFSRWWKPAFILENRLGLGCSWRYRYLPLNVVLVSLSWNLRRRETERERGRESKVSFLSVFLQNHARNHTSSHLPQWQRFISGF